MKKILLVEDDPSIIMGLSYSLQKEGYSVVACSSVATATQQLTQDSFDLLILDLSLPDGSGYEVCQAQKQLRDAPVIFLTARDDEISVVQGIEMGADDYITKPFRLRELLSRIKMVLRRCYREKEQDQQIILDNLTINTASGRITKKGEDLLLTALEYRLFLSLLNNDGKILSRDNLLADIWDAGGEFVNDNTLTVYIKRLREKIEDDPVHPRIILTVRGTGYLLDSSRLQ